MPHPGPTSPDGARERATMGVLLWTKRAIWTALAAAVLCQPVSALAQTGPASGLDISLEDGRLTMNVRDASSVAETSGHDPGRYGPERRAQANR